MGQHQTNLGNVQTATNQPSQPQNLKMKLAKIQTIESLQLEQLVKKIEKLQTTKYRFWVILLVAILLWMTLSALRVYNKWKHMIQMISQAKKDGSQFDVSGFFTALCLEFPFLTRIRFANTHIPYAIMLSYYSSLSQCQMGTGYNPRTKTDYLSALVQAGDMCGNKTSGDCSAESIWCKVFCDDCKTGKTPQCTTSEGCQVCKACENACHSPSYGSAALQYATSMSGWGINIGFAGHMMGSAASGSKFGPIGAGIGLALGLGLGLWQAHNKRSAEKAQCRDNEQYCYNPPGTSKC